MDNLGENLNIAKLQEFIDAYALEKHREIMRDKNRANHKKYRDTHKKEWNDYCLKKNMEYYQRNKEQLSKKRSEF